MVSPRGMYGALLVGLAACSSFGATSGVGGDAGASGDASLPDASASAASPTACGGSPVLSLDFEGTDLSLDSVSKRTGVVAEVAKGDGRHGGGGVFGSSTAVPSAIVIDNEPSLDLGGAEATIAFWLNLPKHAYPDPAVGDQAIFGKAWSDPSAGSYYQYGVELDANGTGLINFYVGQSTGAGDVLVQIPPKVGEWCHLAFVMTGGQVTGFVDGVAATTVVAHPITKRTSVFRVGTDPFAKQPFVGSLDELRIYDRALSPQQIACLATP